MFRRYPNIKRKGFIQLISTLMILGILFAAGSPATVFASTQTLGGSPSEGNLRITVQDSGQMDVERYNSGSWVSQIFASDSKGSRLQVGGTGYLFGYYDTGVQAATISNSTIGNTTTTSWQAGPTEVTQKTTYTNGNAYYRLEWSVTNTSPSTLNDLRFYHGEDTYLSGGDNGAGFWDPANQAIGVTKTVSDSQQRLTLQGITAPFAYESRNYYSVVQSASAGALTNAIDPTESTDNGYFC